MIYHKFNLKRFGLIGNLKILLCKVFGHRVGKTPTVQCCARCGLAYEEIYFPEDYFGQMQKWSDNV